MNETPRAKPTQEQFLLPLLDCLENEGGHASTQDLYDAVALKLGVSEEHRGEQTVIGGKRFNTFERTMRWSQQKAKALGLVSPEGKSVWQLTGKGKDALHTAVPGIVITIFSTSDGIALFGRAEDSIGYVEDRSVQLLFTSPPYPLLREKSYGNLAADQYLSWLLRIAETWPKKLTQTGSVILNLGDVYRPGEPALSSYQERLVVRLEDELGWRLTGRFAWQNPAKLPVPAEYVTIRRIRLKNSLEQLYWFAPNDMPDADNRQVLVPYSDSMRQRIAAGGEKGRTRPSGHQLNKGAFSADNQGAIDGNLIVAANTASNDSYQRLCREQGLPVHPARFPRDLPERAIKLTTKPGDTVLDPFFGSGMTGKVAEDLGRKWIGFDIMADYLMGAANRFPNATIHQPGLLSRHADLLS